MKLFTRLLIFAFLAVTEIGQAQWITVSPNNSDFCGNVPVTYTSSTPAPGNSIEWHYGDYTDYAFTGAEQDFVLGFGTVFYMNGAPFSGCPGGFVRAVEVDPSGNYVNGSSVAILSSVGNVQIPVYAGAIFGNCYGLSVPPCFDPLSTNPFSLQRWAMWYKNGVATGVSSYYLNGPLLDSAWYEYKVRLTCGDTLTTGLYYFWQPSAPVISAQGATTFCTGDTVVLQASSTLAIQYWTKDGVTLSGTSGLTSIKATQSGVYMAVIKTSGPGGAYCYVNSNALTVTVNPGAFITSTVDKACVGDSILLTCTPASSYAWKRNGNLISGAGASSLWVKQSGNYTVNTSGLSCNSSFVKVITFYANPVPTISPAGPITLCSNSAVTLTAGGTNISSYQWQKNGTSLQGATVASMTFTQSGYYKCIVSNSIGCSRTTTVVNVISQSGTALPQKTIVLQPGADGIDTYVTSAFGQYGTNFGTTPTLEVSNWHKYFRTAELGYLNFDLSQIPDGSPIVSANLRMWLDTINQKNVNANSPNSIFFHRNTQAWDEQTLSWYSMPDSTDFQTASVPCSTLVSKSFVTVNITNMMRHWSYQPAERFGMIITPALYNHVTWASFASSDHPTANYRPKLNVTFRYADIIPGGILNLCSGGSVTFSTNNGSFTRQWYRNGVAINGATGTTYTATQAGDYYVILTASSGCTVQSVTRKVTIGGAPQINLVPGVSSYVCQGGTTTLKADSLPGYTFQWKRNGVNISGATQSSITISQSGWYTIVTVSNCGISGRDSVYISKINNPNPVITAGGPTTFCAGGNVILTSNSFANTTYQWLKYGSPVGNAISTIYNVTTAGDYSIRHTANGCSETSNVITVTVNCREGDIIAPALNISVHPVPVVNTATIRLEGMEDYSGLYFELLDLNGKLILTMPCNGTNTLLPGTGIRDGIYLLRTMKGSEQLRVTKIVFAKE